MELKLILESLLFSSAKPLNAGELRGILVEAAGQEGEPETRPFKNVKMEALETALSELAAEHEKAGRSYRLVCVAGAWQFASQPEFAPWLKAMVGQRMRPTKLSQPALETLAIVAYRQPLTRAEMEQIRGVSVDGVIQTLLERGLIEAVGRAEAPGRPVTYGTTLLFLEYFGLRNLEDLPAADELRRIPIQRAETLVTAEPGLATAPPEQLTIAEVIGGASAKPAVPTTATTTSSSGSAGPIS